MNANSNVEIEISFISTFELGTHDNLTVPILMAGTHFTLLLHIRFFALLFL